METNGIRKEDGRIIPKGPCHIYIYIHIYIYANHSVIPWRAPSAGTKQMVKIRPLSVINEGWGPVRCCVQLPKISG